MPKCVHCRERLQAKGKLCFECRKVPGLIERHDRRHDERDDMTEAEVEAMVAEQMQCLPSWWWEDVAAQAEQSAGWVVPFFRRDRRHKGMDTSEGK